MSSTKRADQDPDGTEERPVKHTKKSSISISEAKVHRGRVESVAAGGRAQVGARG